MKNFRNIFFSILISLFFNEVSSARNQQEIEEKIKKRVAELNRIVDKNGSLQSEKVLTYQELKQIDSWGQQLQSGKFKEAHKNLINKIEIFAKENKKIRKLNINVKQFLLELENEAKMESTIQTMLTTENKNEGFLNILEDLEQRKPLHNLILRCKQFIRDIFTETGEASWLDIFSFIPSPKGRFEKMKRKLTNALRLDRKKLYRNYLKNIYELSTIGSEDLDQLVLAELYREHLQSAVHSKRSDLKKALVVGAGPIGIYTAFQIFSTGFEVLVVNDRPETYTRAQTLLLDVKWMEQLRFLLGTTFQKIFKEDERIVELGNEGTVKCKVFENALKERFAELVSFVQYQESMRNGEQHQGEGKIEISRPLDILFEAAFKGVDKSGDEFQAILEVPDKANPSQGEFNKNLIQINAQKLVEDGMDSEKALAKAKFYFFKNNFDEINEMVAKHGDGLLKTNKNLAEIMLSPDERAHLEVNGELMKWRELPKVPFDLLICTGGANDHQCRDNYIGKPEPIATFPYSVTVMQKAVPHRYIFGIKPRLPIVKKVYSGDSDLRKQLEEEAENFQGIIDGIEFESDEIKEKFSQFAGKIYIPAFTDKPRKKQFIWVFDMADTVYIAASTPEVMVDLFQEMDTLKDIKIGEYKNSMEREMSSGKSKKLLDELLKDLDNLKETQRKIERIWFRAIFGFLFKQRTRTYTQVFDVEFNIGTDGTIQEDLDQWKHRMQNRLPSVAYQKLFFDTTNTSTFPVEVKGLDNAVKEIQSENSQIQKQGLAIALGDSLVSPHFVTGSGLSTGRFGVEKALYWLKAYTSGVFTDVEFHEGLRADLKSVKEMTQKTAMDLEEKVRN